LRRAGIRSPWPADRGQRRADIGKRTLCYPAPIPEPRLSHSGLLLSMRRTLLVLAMCAAVFRAGASPAPSAAAGAEVTLRSVFGLVGGAVRDSNGDGLADLVAARIIVPAEPTIEDVEAATNLAGRLGFETTALTLPVVVKASEVQQGAAIALPILVGRTNALV